MRWSPSHCRLPKEATSPAGQGANEEAAELAFVQVLEEQASLFGQEETALALEDVLSSYGHC